MANGETLARQQHTEEKRLAVARFRHPLKSDGQAISRLIASCPPLDANSLYCNLLQCTHFSRSCILAERNGDVIGWVSGYRLPDDPQTLFVWQVAVSSDARGEGLGKALIDALLLAAGTKNLRRLQTTITEPNRASWALFRAIARERGASFSHEEWLARGRDLSSKSESERLVTIGFAQPA